MPPKKVARAPQENISLGPSVRDGMRFYDSNDSRRPGKLIVIVQASWSSALPVSSPLSTTPSSTSLISGSSILEVAESQKGLEDTNINF